MQSGGQDLDVTRREWLATTTVGLACAGSNRFSTAADVTEVDRAAGLLYGGLIGDAMGGPVEFAPQEVLGRTLLGIRDWSAARRVTSNDLQAWAATLPMQAYDELRPQTAPYGPWRPSAPAGTVTDDSRHKIILLRAVRSALADERPQLTEAALAKEYVEFQPHPDRVTDAALAELVEEGLEEYRMAARWVLGERDERRALPVARLWSGVATCSGQMLLPPLAVAYAGRPEEAYRAVFAIDFVDAPVARDFTAALVAGLAAALDPALANAQPVDRWKALRTGMRETDPFRFSEVPFAGRPLLYWLDLAEQFARQAEGVPARLFALLETEGKPVYWWDAHFTLLAPLAMLHFCDWNALAALHLTLDFGHDTDSYAQVLGCMAGAVEGLDLFPVDMRGAVRRTIAADYGEDIDVWTAELKRWGENVKDAS